MASPPVSRVGEARLAGAIARLLRWEAQLLGRPEHDAASRSAALRGLEWAADFARALEAESCAAWLDALRDRANDRPGHTPRAWGLLGAPACAELAGQLEERQSLAPLAPEARGWAGMATAVRTCEELPVPPPRAEPVPAPADLPVAPDPFLDLELADGMPPGAVLAGAALAADPALGHELERALAGWAGEHGIEVDARSGCVELSGSRPSEHAEEGRLSLAALEALRQLHLAAGALAAPLAVADPAGGAVRWTLRLPAATGARHLFVEAAGRRLALPWHAVVNCGLGEGGQSHVVLGRGLERVALPLDWLHGLGEGTRQSSPPAEAVAFDTPLLVALPERIAGEDGSAYTEVAVVPLDPGVADGTPVAVEVGIEADEGPPGVAGDDPGGAPEPLEEPAGPADNPQRNAVAARNALVADDSFTARVFLSRLLEMRGIAVDEAEDGPHALAFLAGRRYDLVFLDAEMPGGGALDIASSMDEAARGAAIVLVRDEAERVAAQAAGFARVLVKPFAEDEVAAAVAALAEESRPGA